MAPEPSYSSLQQALSDKNFASALQRMLRAGDKEVSFYDRTKNGGKLSIDGKAGQYTRKGLQSWAGADPDGNLGPNSLKAINAKLGLQPESSQDILVKALQQKLQDGGFFQSHDSALPSSPSHGGQRAQLRKMHPAVVPPPDAETRHPDRATSPPPAPVQPPPADAAGNSRPKIVLDSGHGDWVEHAHVHDSGATAPKGAKGKVHLKEKDANMLLTQAIRHELQKRGADVSMTHEQTNFRAGDGTKQGSLVARTDKERDSSAVFVSIHHNVRGGEEIIYSNRSQASAAFGRELNSRTGVKARPDVRGLEVLKPENNTRSDGTERPSVLVEAGDLGKAEHRARVLDPVKRQQLAARYAEAIIAAADSPEVRQATSTPGQQQARTGSTPVTVASLKQQRDRLNIKPT